VFKDNVCIPGGRYEEDNPIDYGSAPTTRVTNECCHWRNAYEMKVFTLSLQMNSATDVIVRPVPSNRPRRLPSGISKAAVEELLRPRIQEHLTIQRSLTRKRQEPMVHHRLTFKETDREPIGREEMMHRSERGNMEIVHLGRTLGGLRQNVADKRFQDVSFAIESSFILRDTSHGTFHSYQVFAEGSRGDRIIRN